MLTFDTSELVEVESTVSVDVGKANFVGIGYFVLVEIAVTVSIEGRHRADEK